MLVDAATIRAPVPVLSPASWSSLASYGRNCASPGIGSCGCYPRIHSDRSLRNVGMNSLEGKVALVSGAARGIGAETVRKMAAAGASVLIGDVLVDRARETAKEITD